MTGDVTTHESTDSQAISVIPKGLRSFESHDAEFFLSLLPGLRDRHGIPDCVRFWLAGLPEDQWCDAPNDAGHYGPGMTIKANALELKGFRLPTTNEWEYACRAGIVTR